MFRFLLNTAVSPLFFRSHPCRSLRFMSTTSKSKGHSFTVSYLIHTCGFSPQRAAITSNTVNFKTSEKPDSVIQFFNNNGFSQSKALSIIRSAPYLLQSSDPNKFLLPKIEFFKSKGFSNSEMLSIICRNPNILKRSLENEIIPCFDFFNNMFQSKHKFMKTIVRHSGILFDLEHYSVPNMKVLRQEGVPESHIIRLIEYFPNTIKFSPKRFKDRVEEVKQLGFSPLILNFVLALHVKGYTSESTWAIKEDIYRRWGWADDDIRAAFRLHPHFMTISKHKMEAVMDFLVNKLGFESSAIAKYPTVMSMSLGKRIVPRGSVILLLFSKGLVKQLSLMTIFRCAEKVFLDKFICCHQNEADELLKLYQAKLALAKS